MKEVFSLLYKPVFFEEVPSLQNIVICKLIQECWHGMMHVQKLVGELDIFLQKCNFLQVTIEGRDLKCQNLEFVWDLSWKETRLNRYIFEEAVSLSERTKIQRNMELYAFNLIREFRDWRGLHGLIIFWDEAFWHPGIGMISHPMLNLLYSFDEFEYDVYGRLDWEKTAKNLMFHTELTPYQKFITACVYCFEEEIAQLWPSVQTLLRSESDGTKMEDDKIVQYWITRMTNQLNTDLSQYSTSEMFAVHSTTNSAMKYFWKNVTTFDEKVNCIGLCFERCNDCAMTQCMEYWFPKMNDDFLKCVISRHGTRIMIKLIQSDPKFMLSFWEHTVDMFDGDQFLKILEGLNAKGFQEFRLMCRALWCNTPTKLKTYVLNHYQIEDFSDDLLNYLIEIIYKRHPYDRNIGGVLMSTEWVRFLDNCEYNT